jgi:hypothetical protein
MDFETLKNQIAELSKKIEAGETVRVNVKGTDETGEKQTVPLRVNKYRAAKVSPETATDSPGAAKKKYRGGDAAAAARGKNDSAEVFDLDLTSVDVSDAEIEKIIEEASNRTKLEMDKIKTRDPRVKYRGAASNLPLVVITMRPEDKLWEVYEECRYTPDGDTHTLIAPKGYKTDLASVPRIFWAIIASFELSLAAPVFHDLLYQCAGELPEGKVEPFPRKKFERNEADKIFLELMTKANVSRWKREVAYHAVYYGAWWAWKKRDF